MLFVFWFVCSIHSSPSVSPWWCWSWLHDQDLRGPPAQRRNAQPLQQRLQERCKEGAAGFRRAQNGGERPRWVSLGTKRTQRACATQYLKNYTCKGENCCRVSWPPAPLAKTSGCGQYIFTWSRISEINKPNQCPLTSVGLLE